MVHEPLKYLRTETFSPELGAKVTEPLRDLKNEICSARLEVEPIEALK